MESYTTNLSDSRFFSKDYSWTINEVKDLLKMCGRQIISGPKIKLGCPTDGFYNEWTLKMQADPKLECLNFFTECKHYRLSVRILLSIFDDEKKEKIKEEKIFLECDTRKPSQLKVCDIPHRDIPNHMKIDCKIEAFKLPSKPLTVPTATPPPAPHHDLTELFHQDCKMGQFTDAVLKLGDEEFNVHKIVLRMQSDFFKTRFDQLWSEKEGNVVDMNDPDLDHKLLQALITGAYTGKVSNPDMALKLLPIVDKYQFPVLKLICESMILSQLKTENAISYLILADRHKASDLKRRCIEVCMNDISKIKKTNEWKELMASDGYEDIKKYLYDTWLQ